MCTHFISHGRQAGCPAAFNERDEATDGSASVVENQHSVSTAGFTEASRHDHYEPSEQSEKMENKQSASRNRGHNADGNVIVEGVSAKGRPFWKRIFPFFLLLLFIPTIIVSQSNNRSVDMKINIKDNDPGRYPIEMTEEAWKQRLDETQYFILRKAGTERPFSGNYQQPAEAGIYYSAASGQPLFFSDTKFDSGCGWPSFFAPITPGAIYYRTDRTHGMIRTEVIDSGSGSHLGHVFNDGPPPTGLRYCMNSAALLFVPLGEKPPQVVQDYLENHATEEEKKALSSLIP